MVLEGDGSVPQLASFALCYLQRYVNSSSTPIRRSAKLASRGPLVGESIRTYLGSVTTLRTLQSFEYKYYNYLILNSLQR